MGEIADHHVEMFTSERWEMEFYDNHPRRHPTTVLSIEEDFEIEQTNKQTKEPNP